MLEKIPLSREDSNLVVRAKLPAHAAPTLPLAAVGIAAYFGFASRTTLGGPVGVIARPFEGRDAQTMNNMKQIGLAMHNYLSAYNQLPGHAIYSKDGKTPLLSWRVALLPFLEQDQLYKQFKLDEPWNSEHNKKLIAMMPPTYLSPHAPPPNEPGMTAFKIFVGGGAAWTRDVRGPRVPEITDGFSNTIMVTELADAVTWTKPEDVVYDPKKPLPKLGADPNSDSVLFLMMDGSVHKKPKSIPEASLRAAITRAGGEVLDWYDKRPTAPVLLVPSPPRPPDRP
jgi:hypothetical protein